ncbi:MAG: hypothetical protein QOG57_4955, partial [Pseudonocardiales bacterium]|nr:hypothetical protein [Pseudonocardiales bacterium]
RLIRTFLRETRVRHAEYAAELRGTPS